MPWSSVRFLVMIVTTYACCTPVPSVGQVKLLTCDIKFRHLSILYIHVPHHNIKSIESNRERKTVGHTAEMQSA